VSVNSLLNIARDAIASNQIAINITGANIANVNTPGYTRQRADFNAIGNVDVSSGQADFGVRVESIERLYNRYLETQIVDQAQRGGYDEARQEILGRVEGVFNESGGSGLSDSLNQFWNSWENLSANPTNQVAQYSVVSAASNLASLFRENSNVLSTVQQGIQDNMASTVKDINTLTTEIAGLNEQILASGSEKGSANNLLDRRMELLKSLSDKMNISYYENNDGTLSVFLSNGNILLGGNRSEQLGVTKDITGNIDIVFKSNPTQVLNGVITGGRLGAMIEMGEDKVNGYLDSMNQLADGIVDAVNTLHTTGLDADGVQGAVFFDDLLTGAKNMRVSAAILADPQRIAASVTGNDGENARLIGAIRDNLVMNGDTSTFNDYYTSLVGQVGYDVKAVDGSIERNTTVTNQLTALREGVSGVSLDEEVINLMKYQFGYNAAGRLAKTASDMLDVMMALGQ
jgi:flagellar hook-associated protein 1 FlgK